MGVIIKKISILFRSLATQIIRILL
jgi:hypothetical protein